MPETKQSTLQVKQAELKTLHNQVKKVWDDSDAAGGAELSSDQRKSVIDANKKIESLEHEIAELLEVEGVRTKSVQRDERMRTSVNDLPADIDSQKASRHIKTLGRAFLDDKEIKSFMDRVAPKGSTPTSAQFGSSPRVSLEAEIKSLITGASSTSAGAFVVNQRMEINDTGTFMKPLDILDLITLGETTSDAVEYPRITGFTNNAAAVAEATTTSNGAKPESALAFALETAAVRTIAHWIPVSRRALMDASQIRTWIDTFLLYGLKDAIANEIVNGDGTGEHLLGILNTTGISSQSWDTDMLTVTRKARTKVRIDGRAIPTAYAMNPLDWQTIEMTKDEEGRYYFGGPSVIGPPRLWGLPVVEAEQFTEGTAMCAEWRLATLWDRMQAAILMTDSNSDFFVRNIITILAELRAAFSIIRPKAFCEIEMADPS